ncbi:MAG TPA: hypothetical protein VGG39_28160 [Polyangiaceae bacterium]
MPLDFAADAACDICGARASLRMAVTKLRPQPEMHLALPQGWAVASLEDSGDLHITCPTCPPILVTVPPPEVGDPSTDPTLRPPPAGAPRR